MLDTKDGLEDQNRKSTENIWNLANGLTLFRVLLIPIFILTYKKEYHITALVVFLLASLTDWLDGRVARKYNTITRFGIVMDPLADKLLCVTALTFLASSGKANWIPVTFIIIKEDILMIGSASLIKKGIVLPSQRIGKVAQWLMIVAISLSFFHNSFANWAVPLDAILLWAAMVVTLAALIFYVGSIAKIKKDKSTKYQGT